MLSNKNVGFESHSIQVSFLGVFLSILFGLNTSHVLLECRLDMIIRGCLQRLVELNHCFLELGLRIFWIPSYRYTQFSLMIPVKTISYR